jgi:hypothetical protein
LNRRAAAEQSAKKGFRAPSTAAATTILALRSSIRRQLRRPAHPLPKPPPPPAVRRPGLEVADIFHRHGAAWRKANAGHLSLGQLKAMSAIESCRTAALGGHVEHCEDCGHSRIPINSISQTGSPTT